MVDDLVSRVLSAIERLERAAEEAKGNPARPGTWVSGPRRDHPGYEVADLTSGWVHTQTHGSAQSHHIAVNDPEHVLRLCQSLRDIVTLHAPDELDGRVQCPHCAGMCHSETGLGCEIGGDALFPCDTFLLVARGLGIEEDTDG